MTDSHYGKARRLEILALSRPHGRRPGRTPSARTFALLLATTALLPAPPVAAQNAGAPDAATVPRTAPAGDAAASAGDTLPDIVVTAERRSTRLQETPIAVTALSAQPLESQGIRTINDLAANVPNLTSTTGPQESADANFFVRGVGQFDGIVTNDPGGGVYVGGVYLGRTVGAMLDSSDIARVEVLRGPQGTLFGRNTLGGAVSVTSIQPRLDRLSVQARATYGSRDRIDVDGTVNLPLGGVAALRVSGVTRNQDGWATNFYTGETFGRTERNGARAALLVQPSDSLRITIAGDYTLDRSNPAPSVNMAFYPNPPFRFLFAADAAHDRSSDFYTVPSSGSCTGV